jgi:predicted nucleic acid-binding protein
MNVYPDTTFFVALRFYDDTHHETATQYFQDHASDAFLWSPWHRVEVSNALRQFARGDQPALTAGDARRIIHRLETDVRVGYFLHMEADWRDVLRTAYEISTEHGFSFACRAADLLHVAYAKELAADCFLTFDEDQFLLAEAAGLMACKPEVPD